MGDTGDCRDDPRRFSSCLSERSFQGDELLYTETGVRGYVGTLLGDLDHSFPLSTVRCPKVTRRPDSGSDFIQVRSRKRDGVGQGRSQGSYTLPGEDTVVGIPS